MKSAHGSPVIDFREVLICRLRTGSSLSLPFFLHLFSLLALLHQHPHSYTFIIMCYDIMPWALYHMLAAGGGEWLSVMVNKRAELTHSSDMCGSVVYKTCSELIPEHDSSLSEYKNKKILCNLNLTKPVKPQVLATNILTF